MGLISLVVLGGLAVLLSILGYELGGAVLLGGTALLYWVSARRRGRTPVWGLAAVLVLAYICFGHFMPVKETSRGLQSTMGMSSALYPQVRSGELAIYFGVGTITQVPGDGSVHYWGVLGGPSGAANMEGAEGELAQILLRQKVRPWWANRRRVNAWDLELSPKVSWSLEQRLAHCTGSLDLRGIPVETLRLTVLNSQVTIYVDRALDLHLTALGSQVNLIVPPDLALSPGGQRLQFLGSNNLAEFTAPGGSLRLHWEGFLSSLAVERQRGSDSPG